MSVSDFTCVFDMGQLLTTENIFLCLYHEKDKRERLSDVFDILKGSVFFRWMHTYSISLRD